MELNYIYEDNHIIVVEKPAGVLAQAGSLDLRDMLTEIKAYLKEKYQKPGAVFLGLVHRLDTNVAGVMVFAKTSKAAKRLNEEIRNRTFKKQYLAVVTGKLEINQNFELIDNLKKDETKKKALIVKDGKSAQLNFKVLGNNSSDGQEYSLLQINLITGRYHQIRSQLANFGSPIYNDYKYGKGINNEPLGLYAYKISFNHPTLKSVMTFKSWPKASVFKLFGKEINQLGGEE
jgi:23S rRNA pseudouridine1911/1915/1917 synthase